MGDSETLYVTWIIPDRDFMKVWGQRNRACATYVESQLAQITKQFANADGPDPSRIRRGMFCFAQYFDGTFYRARVLSDVQGSVVKVAFIDYGNKDYVDLQHIRLPDNASNSVLSKMADQAQEYYLARVMAPSNGWVKDCLNLIRQEICYDELYCPKISQVGDQEIISINFHGEDYSSKLIKMGVAREVPLELQTQVIMQSLNIVPQEMGTQRRPAAVQNNYPNPPPGLQQPFNINYSQQNQQLQMDERHGNMPGKTGMARQQQLDPQMNPRLSMPQAAQNNQVKHQMAPVKETSLPATAVYSPSFTPQQNKEPNLQQANITQSIQNMQNLQAFNPSGNPMFNAMPQINPLAPLMNTAVIEALATQLKQHFAPSQDEKPKPKEETNVLQHYEQNVLEVGSAQTVFISHIDDGPWSFSVQWNENENHLSSLMDQIARAKRIPIKRPIALGRPCLAESVSSGELYRGVVVNVSHLAVTVFYVDFGNTENIPVANVYELPPQYLKIKVMSQKFALSGLRKVAPSPEINECFEETVKDDLLLLRVASLEGDNLPTCELYHQGKNIKVILNENLRHIRPEEFPGVGELEKVVATWVESPQKFYVQLKKNDEEIAALRNELAQFASKGRVITPDKLKPGLNCVCLFSGDEEWYRAAIKSVHSEQNTVTVFYIDYGNIDTVSPSSLRRIETGNLISKMNSQAIQCCLYGFENLPFDQATANALELAILEKTLQLQVVSGDEHRIVVNLYDENGVNINLSLLSSPEPSPKQAPVYSPPKTNPAYSPPQLMSVVTKPVAQEQTPSSEGWGTPSPDSAPAYGDRRPNDRFGDRQGRFNDRKFEGKPRRNDSEEDSYGNKNRSFLNRNKDRKGSGQSFDWKNDKSRKKSSFPNKRYDKPQDNWRDDNKKEDSWRGNRREDRGNERRRFNEGDDNRKDSDNDWARPKERSDFGERKSRYDDRDKKGDDEWGKPKERRDFGDRKRFDDRDKKSDDGYGKPKERSDYGERKRYDDSEKKSDDNWGGKKDSNDDWGSKKESNNDWGGKKDSNDDWGGKPKGDFGERKKFEDRDKKFADRPKKFPVYRNDAAPPGSTWSEERMEIGSSQTGIVTYYVNPNDFYVQTNDKKEEFTTMMNEIQKYYVDKFWFKDPPNENDICIARFPADKVLYRAQVTSTSPLTVQYIDYGNWDTVGNRDVFAVDKKFLELPKQSVRCKLSVKPVEENWPSPGSPLDQYFEYEEYTCNFVNYAEETNVYDVELKSGEKDISDEIIQAGFALPEGDGDAAVEAPVESALPRKLPEFELSLLENQVFSFNISYIYNLDKFYININSHYAEIVQTHVDSYTAVEENLVPIGRENMEVGKLCISSNGEAYYRARILELTDTGANIQFIDYGDCLEVTDDVIWGITNQIAAFPPQATECRLLKTKDKEIPEETHETFKATYENVNVLCLCSSVDKDDPTTLNVMLYELDGQKLSIVDKDIDDSPHQIDPIGSVLIATQFVDSIFSHFDSPKEIYIHRIEDDASLNEYSNNLNVFYNAGIGLDFNCTEPENLNQICVAKSIADELWYRCRLIGNEVGASVHYLDYGNVELVPFENVKKIDPAFCEQFIFAKKVELAIEYEEEKVEAINEKLGELSADKNFIACFVRKDGVTYAEFLTDGKRLSEILEEEGLCKKNGVFDDFDFSKKEEAEPEFEIGAELKGYFAAMDENVKTWFCVQLAEASEQLDLLVGKLQEVCEILPAETNVPNNNEIFAAKFIEDDSWYRAKIHRQDGDNLFVYFIDYGNTAEVNLSDGAVKLLPDDLKNLPPFVKNCSLEGEWNAEGHEKLAEILADVHDEITIVVKDIQERLIVDLIINGESIVEKLRNEGFAQAPDSSIVYVTHTNSLKDFYIQMEKDTGILNKITEELKNSENFENAEIIEVNEIYSAQFPDDEEWYRARIIKNEGEIEAFFIDYGNTSIVTNVKILPDELKNIPAIAHNCELIYPDDVEEWQEEDLNKFLEFVADGLTVKEEKKRGGKLFVSLYQNGERIQDLIKTTVNPRPGGIITHVNSLTDFYIRFNSKEEEMNLITEKIAEADSFEDLELKEIGAKCAAKFLDDDLWYRAEIVKNLGESYEVKFIDYGNISEVFELKKLNEELSQYEPLAVNVCLKNATDDVPDSVKEEFIEMSITEPQVEFKFLIDDSTTPATCSVRWFGINLDEYLFIEKSGNVDVIARTDDDKTRLGIVETLTNLDDDHRVQTLTLNETDEEKRVKAAMGTDNEGFKSDDEKGNSEMAVQTVNITDNDLIGEHDDSVQIIEPETPETGSTEYPDIVVESPEQNESVELIENDSSSTIQMEKTESDMEQIEGIADKNEKSNTESDNEIEKGEVVTPEELEIKSDDEMNIQDLEKIEEPADDNETGNTDENFVDAECSSPETKILNTENGHVNGTNDVSLSPVQIKKEPEETDVKTESTPKQTLNDLPDSKFKSLPRRSLSKVDKIVPGSICRGISNDELERNSSTPMLKIPNTEKIIPGSINRGISFEHISSEEGKPISVSAPATPSATRKIPYRKTSHQEKVVPGCISSGSPIEENIKSEDKPEVVPKYEKIPRSEHIIPGVVSGSSSTLEE